MKNNKKRAFTLIEIILVIALLAILATISIISIGNITLKIKQKALDNQYALLEKAAENYVNDHLEEDLSNSFTLSLEELSNTGYLKTDDVTNPVTNVKMTGCVFIRYKDNKHSYNYVDDCSNRDLIARTNNSYIWGTDYLSNIETVTFDFGIPLDYEKHTWFDMSKLKDKSILAILDKNSNNKYDVSILSNGFISATNLDSFFTGMTEVKKIIFNNFDTVKVTNMKSLFSNCYNICDLDLSSFNTTSVVDMSYMFALTPYAS